MSVRVTLQKHPNESILLLTHFYHTNPVKHEDVKYHFNAQESIWYALTACLLLSRLSVFLKQSREHSVVEHRWVSKHSQEETTF